MRKNQITLNIVLALFISSAFLSCGSSPTTSTADDAANQTQGKLISTIVLGKVGA